MAGPGTKRTDSPGALHQTPPNQPREGSSRRPVLGTTLRPAAILCPEPSSAGSAPKRPVTGRRASPGGCRRPRRSGDPILGAKKGGEGASHTLRTSRPGDADGTSSASTLQMPCVTDGLGLASTPGRQNTLERPPVLREPKPVDCHEPLPYPPALAQACGPPALPLQLHTPTQ